MIVILFEGPWCADRAAFALLIKIENLKVKTPYERHYLLLCMVSTVMVNIRALCENEFQAFTSDHGSIYAFSTPKVLRLIEVLSRFKPDTPKKKDDAAGISGASAADATKKEEALSPSSETSSKEDSPLISETLKLVEAAESSESNSLKSTPLAATPTEDNLPLKEPITTLDIYRGPRLSDLLAALDVIRKNCDNSKIPTKLQAPSSPSLHAQNIGGRWKNRPLKGNRKGGPNFRNRTNFALDPDALCAIIFVEKRFSAKILYYLINVRNYSYHIIFF